MRPRLVLSPIGLVFCAACASDPRPEVVDATPITTATSRASVDPTSAPVLRTEEGKVTVRFTNPTGADVFFDVTYGVPVAITSPEAYPLERRHFCTPSCDECACKNCGDPMSRVQRVPPGGAFEWTWDGSYFVVGRCGGSSRGCDCDAENIAEPGTYEIVLRGGDKADTEGAPQGDDRFTGSLVTGGKTCTAKATMRLERADTKVDAAFTCEAK